MPDCQRELSEMRSRKVTDLLIKLSHNPLIKGIGVETFEFSFSLRNVPRKLDIDAEAKSQSCVCIFSRLLDKSGI